jgi:hypothetical protein
MLCIMLCSSHQWGRGFTSWMVGELQSQRFLTHHLVSGTHTWRNYDVP